ncbi:TetR/AcrR family transcriptional regulator [Desulfonatronospira sp.]|uniref:TetR/AcrR family transcriptional regulator n=1 Tax=Desulfonatronospira sp. TaxID=1962951 RepID=UPI0025C601DA|nr:TetR/AcrR family transcriptional regulator [Desulfonatronospira sp.]
MAKNKKQDILDASAELFASQGFDNTTTLMIAKEARVTEPLLYYHFKGKEDIFSKIIHDVFKEYAQAIEDLPKNTDTEFEKLANLIRFHMHIAEKRPREARLLLANCPLKLLQRNHACKEIMESQHEIVQGYIQQCLEAGNAKGEFDAQPVDHMAIILFSLVNEILRRKTFCKDDPWPDEDAVIDFCKRALIRL